jgi:hypothetical protein
MECICEMIISDVPCEPTITVRPHYPYMGKGLVRSLFTLVWEALYQTFMEGHRAWLLLNQVDSTNPALRSGQN